MACSMTPSHADVIIIGGGPAGCAAGISCAQNGLTVLMISGNNAPDKGEIHPAESVHPGIETLLTELNAAHCIQIASRGVYDKILVNSQYNRLGAGRQGKWQGHHIDRKLFDQALLSSATQQGVTLVANDVVENIKVNNGRPSEIVTKTGRNFTCTWVIDASGYKSFVGKLLGFKEEFYSRPLIVWTGIASNNSANNFLLEKNTARFITSSPGGWTWLAPESSGNCTWTKLSVKGKQDFSPPDELDGSLLIGKIKKSNRRWRVFRPVCTEGVLLCGDAAGIIDPAAGQGILTAIFSGIMAAKTIGSCINDPDFTAFHLARYDEWFVEHYRKKVEELKQFYALQGIA